jgi:recombination DNA repair RAD52 pathway protein
MTKDNTPYEAKANHKLPLKPRQSNQASNSTKDIDSPEVENTRFHQLSLDTPQDKHRPLNQQGKSKRI